jgi:hypothetical protein
LEREASADRERRRKEIVANFTRMRYGKAHDSHDDEALSHRADRRIRGQHDGGSRARTAENRPPPHEALVARFIRSVGDDDEKAGRKKARTELEFDDAGPERQAGVEKTGSQASTVHEAAIAPA